MDELIKQLLAATQAQNNLLQRLATTLTEGQTLRNQQLQAWQQANPQIVAACQSAVPILSEIQSKFLADLTEELNSSGEQILDNQYSFNEFVDRFGQRLAHLNAMFQVVTQFGAATPAK